MISFRQIHLLVFGVFLTLWTIALLIPIPQEEAEKAFGSKDRVFFFGKGLHVTAYAFLTLLGGTRFCRWSQFRWLLLGLPLHGGVTEILQAYTGRGSRWADFYLDTAGVVVGSFLLGLGLLIRGINKPKLSNRHENQSE
jgi:VanZ family protein